MINYDYKEVLKLQKGYIAKSSGEPLSTHSFMVYSALKKLLDDFEFPLPPIGNFSESDVKDALLLAALVHDIGKMRDYVQKNLKEGKAAGKHQATKDELKEYLDKVGIKMSDDLFEFVYELILHHFKSWDDLRKQQVPGIGFLSQYLKIADWIGSMHKLDFSWLAILKERFESFTDYTITGVLISRFDSPAYHKLVEVAVETFKEKGWKVVRYLDNGVLFAGKDKPPHRDLLINKAYKTFIDTLLLNIKPQFGAQSILDIIKKAFLMDWINVQRDELLKGFAEANERYYFFLKFIRELLELINKDSSYGFLKCIVRMRAHKMIEKEYNLKFDNSIEAINETVKMKNITLSDCLPPDIIEDVFSNDGIADTKVAELKSQEMFDILHKLSNYVSKNSNKLNEIGRIKDIFKEYLASIISIEESLDFTKIANDLLGAYKNYKSRRGYSSPTNVYLATCEFCGAPTIIPTQEALGLPESKLFTTSKGKADSHMAICPLCVFDIQYLQKELSLSKRDLKNSIPLFIKIKKDVYEINPDRFQRAIAEINVSKGKLKKLSILPDKYVIPIEENPKKMPEYSVISDEVVFFVESIPPNEWKNTYNKYFLHYWVLSNMNVRVSIGEYMSTNYFNQIVFPDDDTFKKGLLIQLTSKAFQRVKKVSQSYLRAGNIVENNPAALFGLISDYSDRFGKKVIKEIVEIIKILKEVPMYMGLLEDAKFWSSCLREYFIDWGGNKKFSKHFVTKALSRGLSMIIQTNDVEFAFAEFLKYIRDDISQDKRQTLEETLKKSKEKFEEYWKMRNEDIGKFINFRNALVTATYLMVRYDEVRSVV